MTDQSSNDQFHASSFMQGHNAAYLEQLYAQYAQDPGAVDEAWRAFFAALGDAPADAQAEAQGPSWARSVSPSSGCLVASRAGSVETIVQVAPAAVVAVTVSGWPTATVTWRSTGWRRPGLRGLAGGAVAHRASGPWLRRAHLRPGRLRRRSSQPRPDGVEDRRPAPYLPPSQNLCQRKAPPPSAGRSARDRRKSHGFGHGIDHGA